MNFPLIWVYDYTAAKKFRERMKKGIVQASGQDC